MEHCVDRQRGLFGMLSQLPLCLCALSEDDVFVAYWQHEPLSICLVSERQMIRCHVPWDLAVVGTAVAKWQQPAAAALMVRTGVLVKMFTEN